MSVIKDYRKKRKLSQKELATLLSVNVITIIRWEKKETTPTLLQAKKLCNELRIPFKKLYLDY